MSQHRGNSPQRHLSHHNHKHNHNKKETHIMRINSVKTLAATACTVALLSAVGCGSDEASTDAGTGDTTDSASEPSEDMPSGEEPDMSTQMVGAGCEQYAKEVPDGPGSVAGMAGDKVAEAASNNPLLTQLVAAVSGQINPKVNLVDDLNGGEFTVFAPIDSAFEALDAKTLKALSKPANADMLSSILTYHVVEGQLAPDAVVGEQATLQGGMVEVTGEGDMLKVNDANVVCGGVKTANATVYLIDGLLMPAAA